MPFEITEMGEEEMRVDGVFKEVVDAQWDSYENPYTRLLNLFFPIKASGPEDHTRRIQDSLIRQIHEHKKSSPSSRWLKAVDTETGEIAGGAQWYIFEENPYAAPEDEELTFWESGEDREFATALVVQFLAARMTWMQKPHVRKIFPDEHGLIDTDV